MTAGRPATAQNAITDALLSADRGWLRSLGRRTGRRRAGVPARFLAVRVMNALEAGGWELRRIRIPEDQPPSTDPVPATSGVVND